MKKIPLITFAVSIFLSIGTFGMEGEVTDNEEIKKSQQVHIQDFTTLLCYERDEQPLFWQKLSIPIPTVAVFQKNGKELRYILAQRDIGTLSPTFRLILETIQDFNPSCLILEGFDNQDKTIERISATSLTANLEHCEALVYAAYLAKTNRIPFRGGEPSDQKILDSLIEQGYEERDLVFFYFMRQIPQEYRQEKLHSAEELPGYFNIFIQNHIPFTQHDIYTYEKYQSWLIEIFGNALSFNNLIDGEVTTPGTKNKVQQIAHAVNAISDQEVLTRIVESLEDYHKILVIFGSSRYYYQHKALQFYLGNPEYTVS